MANERRRNPRYPVKLDAVLNFERHVVVGAVRDLSLNGAFIELQSGEVPYSRASVELGLTLTANGESRYCRFPAHIRRVCDGGAGVSFADVGIEDYFQLVDAVFSA